MANLRLDTSRPYGTITPPYHSAVYSQTVRGRERYFGPDKERVFPPGDPGDGDLAAPAAALSKAPDQPSETEKRGPGRPRKQAKASVDAAAKEDAAEPPPPPQSPDDVNLSMWALGEARYPFAAVREAILKRFNSMAVDERRAIEILEDNGIVPEGKARVGKPAKAKG